MAAELIFSLAEAAHCMEVAGRWHAAEAASRQLTAIAPKLLFPRYRLANVLANLGDWDCVVAIASEL